MRRISLVLLTIFMVLMLVGSAIAQEGNLTVWVAASPAEGQNLIQAFSEHYPNINVDMIRAGSGELLTRIMAR